MLPCDAMSCPAINAKPAVCRPPAWGVFIWTRAADAWSPLQHLHLLTQLNLGRAPSKVLPPELASCTALLELQVEPSLWAWGW